MPVPEEWWSYQDFRFRKEQVLWAIKHLPELKEGIYPTDPVGGSGYVDKHIGKSGVKRESSFVKPAIIAGEVEARLGLCGLDGLILKALILWEETPEYLTKCLSISEQEIYWRRSRALAYISGWRRKRVSYREFISHRKTTSQRKVP